MQHLEEESTRLTKGGLEAYAQGFEKAKRQAAFFVPNIDLIEFDVDKDVNDGALVEENTAEEVVGGGVAIVSETRAVVIVVAPKVVGAIEVENPLTMVEIDGNGPFEGV